MKRTLALSLLAHLCSASLFAADASKPTMYQTNGEQAFVPLFFMSEDAVKKFYSEEAAKVIFALRPYAEQIVKDGDHLRPDGTLKPNVLKDTSFGMILESDGTINASFSNRDIANPFEFSAKLLGDGIVQVLKI